MNFNLKQEEKESTDFKKTNVQFVFMDIRPTGEFSATGE
jgi:hypothetical protein